MNITAVRRLRVFPVQPLPAGPRVQVYMARAYTHIHTLTPAQTLRGRRDWPNCISKIFFISLVYASGIHSRIRSEVRIVVCLLNGCQIFMK